MFLKRSKLAVTVSAAALLIAACSSDGGNGDSPSPSNGPEQPQGTVSIDVWHYWDGTNADEFESLIREFNNSQDAVRVSATNVPNAEFLTKLRASSSSDTLPDIAIGDLVWVPQVNQIGSLADLNGNLSSEVLADIAPALKDFGTIDGRQVSVPVSANNLAYIYNKDLFKEAGLDPEQPPATWDEVKETGMTIRDATGRPAYELPTQAGDSGEGLTWQFQVNLWQAGGEFLTADNSQAAFNTEAGQEALQYWVDLIDSGVAAPVGPWGEFGKGSTAAATDGSWMVGIWAPDPPFDFGVGLAPAPSSGTAATNLGGEQALVFDNSSERVDAAAAFLGWFLAPEQVIRWSENTGMLPVTTSVSTSEEYLSWVDSSEPRLRPFVEQMQIAKARPNTPLYPAISLAFAREIEKVLAGSVSVQDGLANAEQAVNDVLQAG